jgi:nitroreductase
MGYAGSLLSLDGFAIMPDMTTPPKDIHAALAWRYATKIFDPAKKLTPEQWAALEATLVMSPSAYGLQPWKFVNVTNPALRAALRKEAHNQPSVTDASHLVVLLSLKKISKADVEHFIERVAEVRGTPIEKFQGYADMMMGDVVTGPRAAVASEWAARQAYIAFGFLMFAAAAMKIDACPIEGMDPAAFDKLLPVPEGYRTLAACALGFRDAAIDKYATLPKVRFPASEVVLTK